MADYVMIRGIPDEELGIKWSDRHMVSPPPTYRVTAHVPWGKTYTQDFVLDDGETVTGQQYAMRLEGNKALIRKAIERDMPSAVKES